MPTNPTVPSGRVILEPLMMKMRDMSACIAIRRGIIILPGKSSADRMMTSPGSRDVVDSSMKGRPVVICAAMYSERVDLLTPPMPAKMESIPLGIRLGQSQFMGSTLTLSPRMKSSSFLSLVIRKKWGWKADTNHPRMGSGPFDVYDNSIRPLCHLVSFLHSLYCNRLELFVNGFFLAAGAVVHYRIFGAESYTSRCRDFAGAVAGWTGEEGEGLFSFFLNSF